MYVSALNRNNMIRKYIYLRGAQKNSKQTKKNQITREYFPSFIRIT